MAGASGKQPLVQSLIVLCAKVCSTWQIVWRMVDGVGGNKHQQANIRAGDGAHQGPRATASTDIRGRPNTLRRHPMTSTSAVTPLTSWEAASRPRARHRPPASAWRDPGSSASHARSAPTVASPRPSSPNNAGADAAGLRCDWRGVFRPAEIKASDKA